MIDCESDAVFRERIVEHETSTVTSHTMISSRDGVDCVTTSEVRSGRDFPVGPSSIVTLVTEDATPIATTAELRCPDAREYVATAVHHRMRPTNDTKYIHELLVRIEPPQPIPKYDAGPACTLVVRRVGQAPLSAHWNVFPITHVVEMSSRRRCDRHRWRRVMRDPMDSRELASCVELRPPTAADVELVPEQWRARIEPAPKPTTILREVSPRVRTLRRKG